MSRMYSVSFNEVAVTATQDLFEIVAPADMSVAIHAVILSQSSDAGDSESEQLSVLVHRGSTSGSGGSTPTPAPLSVGTTASTVTVEANNTTQSTVGTQLHIENFNVMAGLAIYLPPECKWIISPSGRLIIELQLNPDDEVTMSGTIYFEEIGG